MIKNGNCGDDHKEKQGVPAVLAKDAVLSISCACGDSEKEKNLASSLVNQTSKVSPLFRHMACGRNHSGSQDFEEIHMRGGDVLTVLCRCTKLRR